MNLTITQLNFHLTIVEKMVLQEHPESSFRGAFGHELHELACFFKKKGCSGCPKESECAYRNFFEPEISTDQKQDAPRGFQTKPRPYIIEVKNNRKSEFLPGDELEVHLRIFGEVKRYLPYIILTWQQMGQKGLGSTKGKFIISEIWNSNPLIGKSERIYSEYLNLIYNVEMGMEFPQVDEIVQCMPTDRIRIKLLTPMMLKADSRYVKNLEFPIFLRNLFRRLSSLFFFYGDEPLRLEFSDLLEMAKQVKLVRSNVRIENWNRYSNRQQQKVEMSGLVGEVIFEGDLKPFLPYLVFGQYCYIGKNTVFGQGNYKIIPA